MFLKMAIRGNAMVLGKGLLHSAGGAVCGDQPGKIPPLLIQSSDVMVPDELSEAAA
jgi:hypothetical protein